MSRKGLDRASLYGYLIGALHKNPWLGGNWGRILTPSTAPIVRKGHMKMPSTFQIGGLLRGGPFSDLNEGAIR